MNPFPGEHLVRWCLALPPELGLYVAHLHLICTGRDLSPLFLDAAGIRNEFQKTVLRPDIPVRMAVNVSTTMASISFVLGCLASVERAPEGGVFPAPPGGARPSAERAVWLELLSSFAKLEDTLCSQKRIAAWLREELARQAAEAARQAGGGAGVLRRV
jgi:hypothetical protein